MLQIWPEVVLSSYWKRFYHNGSEITPCIKIDITLVVYRLSETL